MVNIASPKRVKIFMQKISDIFTKANCYQKKLYKGNWFRVPNILIDQYGKALGTSGIAVYCVLARYANNVTRKAFPSHGQIANRLGISRRTVIRKLKKLEEIGLIQTIGRKSKHSVYLLR